LTNNRKSVILKLSLLERRLENVDEISNPFLCFSKIKNKRKVKMKLLKIGSRVCLSALIEACEKNQAIEIPASYNGGHMSSVNVLLKEVNPLGKDGCSFFKGETIQANGEKPVYVDGATRMEPKEKDSHDYGYLAIYYNISFHLVGAFGLPFNYCIKS